MKKYKVYKFTNLLNDKAYIGITSKEDPVERYKEHLESARLGNVPQNHHYGAIHAALNKYGKDNFFFEVIEEYDDVNDCKNAEIANIAKYKTYVRDEKGYNLTKGGDGLGLVISEEARQKMSEARKGKYVGAENPFYGKHHSDETKKFISDFRKQERIDNLDEYIKRDLAQCNITPEQCKEILMKYLTGNFSYDALADEYKTNLKVICQITHNNYAAIKFQNLDPSLFEKVKKIKKERHKNQYEKYIKPLNESEKEILQSIKNKIPNKDIRKKYPISSASLSKLKARFKRRGWL